MFVPVCTLDPGPGTACPTASLGWVDQSVLTVFPDLSPSDVAEVGAGFLTLFVMAFCIRLVLRQFKV